MNGLDNDQIVSLLSFPELFRDCEVTFTGIKHPLASGWRTGGWKDDITFHPTSRRTEDRDECATIPAGSPCHPGRPLETVASGSVCGGELIGDSPAEAADDIPTRGAVEPPVCRGKFWRNMKRDAGTYVLKPSPPRGNAVGVDGGDWDWELNLHWDGWSTEVVRIQEVLENGAGQLRFEGVQFRCVPLSTQIKRCLFFRRCMRCVSSTSHTPIVVYVVVFGLLLQKSALRVSGCRTHVVPWISSYPNLKNSTTAR